MTTAIGWGILGTGDIAHQFALGLRQVRGAELVAIGSRDRQRAEAFGEQFGVPHRFEGYGRLVEDPAVDVVYVATPHNTHERNAALCLHAGKAVLVEKPFTLNAAQARRVVDLARQRGLFLMVAMWMRFLPPLVHLRELLARQVVGAVRLLLADFGIRAEFDPKSRLFDPALGGGALLDLGVYPISLASMVLGQPSEVHGLAHLGPTGVDEQNAVMLKYPAGQLALLHSAIRAETPHEACIVGEQGRIHLHRHWWKGSRLSVIRGEDCRDIDLPIVGNGYNYQAEEVVRCLQAGLTESLVMPPAESLSIMQTMDRLRASWGLRYPDEASAHANTR